MRIFMEIYFNNFNTSLSNSDWIYLQHNKSDTGTTLVTSVGGCIFVVRMASTHDSCISRSWIRARFFPVCRLMCAMWGWTRTRDRTSFTNCTKCLLHKIYIYRNGSGCTYADCITAWIYDFLNMCYSAYLYENVWIWITRASPADWAGALCGAWEFTLPTFPRILQDCDVRMDRCVW